MDGECVRGSGDPMQGWLGSAGPGRKNPSLLAAPLLGGGTNIGSCRNLDWGHGMSLLGELPQSSWWGSCPHLPWKGSTYMGMVEVAPLGG